MLLFFNVCPKLQQAHETNKPTESFLVEGNVEILACFVQIYPFDCSSRGLNDSSIELLNKKNYEKLHMVINVSSAPFQTPELKNACRAEHVINPQLHFSLSFLSLSIFCRTPKLQFELRWCCRQRAGNARTDPCSVLNQRFRHSRQLGEDERVLKATQQSDQSERIATRACPPFPSFPTTEIKVKLSFGIPP